MFSQLNALIILVLFILILVQVVVWPHFGRIVSRIRHPGRLVETVGVAVHLPRIQDMASRPPGQVVMVVEGMAPVGAQ